MEFTKEREIHGLASLRLATRPPPAVLDGGGSTSGFGDDDELLVRASAVLKSQGPENWSRGRPGQKTLWSSPSPSPEPLPLVV